MIRATIYQTIAEVKISGNKEEFDDDLKLLKSCIPGRDRSFNDSKKVWTISNPDLYTNVPFINIALKERSQQMSLF